MGWGPKGPNPIAPLGRRLESWPVTLAASEYFSAIDRKKLVARLAHIGVRECFRNHAYRFKQETYMQQDGGPIGLKLTTVVAELVMAEWDVEFRRKMI